MHFLLSSMYPSSHSQVLVSKLQLPLLASVQSSLLPQTRKKWKQSNVFTTLKNYYSSHSQGLKVRKNCPRLDIENGNSLGSKKVRKNQRKACSPKDWGFMGPKLPKLIVAKWYLERGCFWLYKVFQNGQFTIKFTFD